MFFWNVVVGVSFLALTAGVLLDRRKHVCEDRGAPRAGDGEQVGEAGHLQPHVGPRKCSDTGPAKFCSRAAARAASFRGLPHGSEWKKLAGKGHLLAGEGYFASLLGVVIKTCWERL